MPDMNRKTILVVDDDHEIVRAITITLEREGYHVLNAYDGLQALDCVTSREVHLIIIDVMMPKLDGLSAVMKIREKKNLPIIILSAKGEDSDKILGLSMGADDYMAKPFNPLELVARVKALLRRAAAQMSELKRGELLLNLSSHELWKNDKQIVLTPTEYKLLSLMMKNPGRIFTKAQLYENINGEFFESDENTIMVHISKLRDKIETDPKRPTYIKTVRGVGYRFEG